MNWQPIETAPKNCDGIILVWGRIWSKIGDKGKDNLENWEKAQPWTTSNIVNGTCYVAAGFADGDSAECRATYWMPIEPPNSKEGAGDES